MAHHIPVLHPQRKPLNLALSSAFTSTFLGNVLLLSS